MSDSDNDPARAMEAYAQAEQADPSEAAAREAVAEAERQAEQAAIDDANVAAFDPPPAPTDG